MVETINLFQKLGFGKHPDKNKFIPARIVEYLSFTINSEKTLTCLSDQRNIVALFQQNQNLYQKNLVVLLVLPYLHFQKTILANVLQSHVKI